MKFFFFFLSLGCVSRGLQYQGSCWEKATEDGTSLGQDQRPGMALPRVSKGHGMTAQVANPLRDQPRGRYLCPSGLSDDKILSHDSHVPWTLIAFSLSPENPVGHQNLLLPFKPPNFPPHPFASAKWRLEENSQVSSVHGAGSGRGKKTVPLQISWSAATPCPWVQASGHEKDFGGFLPILPQPHSPLSSYHLG